MNDLINPNHYKTPSGVSCIDIAELFPYSLVSRILDGRLEYALIHIDDWLVE